MKIETKAVHAGDRKKAGPQIPVATPIQVASSYYYETVEQLDKVFAREQAGYCYSRHDNPTNSALEELAATLENGRGALACASGMAALQIAITAALVDRSKSVLAADALYGATTNLLMNVFAPMGVDVRFADFCDMKAVEQAIAAQKPGCVLLETISNPLLRVAEVDRIAEAARAAGAATIVDNTFATPLLIRPLELGANMVVHSATKYLAGHGDVLAGLVITDSAHYDALRALSRAYGPVLGLFEAFLTMRGIKTFPLRMERQCANARCIAAWLEKQSGIERVHFPGNPGHTDAAVVKRLLPEGLFGGMISFELKDAGREQVFAFMERLKLIVPATSLGDVHSMILYPVMSSHRDVSPKQRERLGIRENLVRLSSGIESVDDIIADLAQALG